MKSASVWSKPGWTNAAVVADTAQPAKNTKEGENLISDSHYAGEIVSLISGLKRWKSAYLRTRMAGKGRKVKMD